MEDSIITTIINEPMNPLLMIIGTIVLGVLCLVFIQKIMDDSVSHLSTPLVFTMFAVFASTAIFGFQNTTAIDTYLSEYSKTRQTVETFYGIHDLETALCSPSMNENEEIKYAATWFTDSGEKINGASVLSRVGNDCYVSLSTQDSNGELIPLAIAKK